ncbi:YtfP, gamma-glutamylcyclotransferase (GGCT)/AIG2-like family protein [Halalkaliarchaeum sp. AArc-CO]|uniref:gamma-glutamylcyclotransferase family protein n=1 Tax=Halalkaliarchaeum sp. AArc-CO TaxID=2866381 RepID=UPI00217DA1BE|nr:gamma-glutamylcyclotransferase family protein [Halalkaliarchaeum sp. AArc-CO]UWG49678.1 YtfP, gamma-glutamylcyclotransferase (GGCT)/AIG2-like family protein [Halalkaliarchaeum sp. AArc-CO]
MDVFVYGTLTAPDRVGELLDSFVFVGAATLHGLHAVEGRYPTLAPGGRVAGRLLRTDEIERLDRYEGVDRGLYARVSVPVEDERIAEAAVYVGDPERLDADVTWPGTGPFRDRVEEYLTTENVRIVPTPPNDRGRDPP